MSPSSVGVLRALLWRGVWLVPLVLLEGSLAFSQQSQPPSKLETPQETNDRIRQLANTIHPSSGDYVIGSSDLIQVDVFDVPELSREFRVGETGYISMPLVPVKVRASGLTAFQLEEKLAELLQVNGLVSHPQVSVFVKEARSQPITILGAVKAPTVYQALRQTTLVEVISAAGGLTEDAGSTVIITRPPKEAPAGEANNGSDGVAGATAPTTIPINLNDLLDSGDPKFNIPLQGGDVVSVPRAGVVYVVGAVEKPGGYVLQSDRDEMTVLKVLALSGGLKPTAKPRQAVIIRRGAETSPKEELSLDLQKILERKSEDIGLRASDILFVPDSTGKRALRRTGEVALALASGVAIFRLGR